MMLLTGNVRRHSRARLTASRIRAVSGESTLPEVEPILRTL